MPILKPVKQHFFIQWLHPRFYEAVAELECYSCENFWTVSDIQEAMNETDGHGYVLTEYTTPVGYVLFTKRDERCIIGGLVVHPDYRLKGWGSLLLQRAMDKWNITAEVDVRESNLGAHLFLQKNGFLAESIMKDYFLDEYEGYVEKEDGFHFVRGLP